MSHKFQQPKPISEARRAVARAEGLTANALVLTTESKEKYAALLASYREEYDPQGQTENDLVEELTAAKWLQRRIVAMITGLLDVTMDLMDNGKCILLNEPKPPITPEAPSSSGPQLVTRDAPLVTQPGIFPNEPKPPVTHESSISSGQLRISETGHQPLGTGHCCGPPHPVAKCNTSL